MQRTTELLIANPCDDEEDNMALLCCFTELGEMLRISRYPDEDVINLDFDEDSYELASLTVTLDNEWLRISVPEGVGHIAPELSQIDIRHNTPADLLGEAQQTLQVIVQGLV